MHRVRQLAALRPLLTSGALPNVAQTAAYAGPPAQGLVQSTVTAATPALGFTVAATARTFASGPQGPDRPDASSVEARQNSSISASTSQSLEGQDADAWMEDWAKMVEKGDSVGQAELLQNTFGEDPEPVGPPLHELLNYNRKEEERAKRRMFELQKQEQIRQSRCVHVTFLGYVYS